MIDGGGCFHISANEADDIRAVPTNHAHPPFSGQNEKQKILFAGCPCRLETLLSPSFLRYRKIVPNTGHRLKNPAPSSGTGFHMPGTGGNYFTKRCHHPVRFFPDGSPAGSADGAGSSRFSFGVSEAAVSAFLDFRVGCGAWLSKTIIGLFDSRFTKAFPSAAEASASFSSPSPSRCGRVCGRRRRR